MNAKRLIYNDLEGNLLSRPIKILLGARQVGKTYLLKALEQEARRQGLTTAYFNLEIPADIVKFSDDKVQVFDLLTSTARVLFIDEFHYLPNIASLFKAVYDSGAKVSIFASGSSALEIHKNLKESLAGRRFIYKVYPLSFEECLNNHLPTENYLVEGGVPGLLNLPERRDKQVYLNGLVETYILKDVKALIKEENVKAFNHLLYFLAEHQGSVITVASLAQEVGLTARTVEKHLSILEQTYVCYGLSSYSTRLSNELKKSKKYYFFDLGIRNAILRNFDYALDKRPDKGVLLESAVFLELMRKGGPDSSLCFWRTKQQQEVDFIKLINRKPIPIEVKSHAQQDSLPEGLKAFIDRYPSTEKAYVVSLSLTGRSRYKDCGVEFITLKDVAKI